jgi:flagellar assembly factor FliW
MPDPLVSMGAWPNNGAERIHLPEGLLGYENCHDFFLSRGEGLSPFLGLVCEDRPEVSFVVAPPGLFCDGEYHLPLSSDDRGVLQLGRDENPQFLVIISLSADRQEITANLKGPVAINPRCRIAKQVVVYNPSLSLRAPLLKRFSTEVIPVRREA